MQARLCFRCFVLYSDSLPSFSALFSLFSPCFYFPGETDWKLICIDVNDPNAEKLNDISDVEKVMPGKLKEVFEFLRDYKIPDGKPANKFAFNDEVKDKAFALEITRETYDEWRKLIDGKVTADDVSTVNTTQNGTAGFTAAKEVETLLA